MFFYSFQTSTAENASLALSSGLDLYPYRTLALAFVGCGSLSMVTASISYSKRSKNILH
jgi:hypothetical protein